MDQLELQTKLRNLREAIAEGILEIEFQNKKIRYRSLDEMRRIEQDLIRQMTPKKSRNFQKITTVFEKF